MAGTCTACQGDPVHRSANGSINQNAPISCRQTKPKQRGSYADLRSPAFTGRPFYSYPFRLSAGSYALYDYPDGAILTRKNDEWFIQLFRYASHTPPTLTETLDIPLTYQEIDQLDDINSFLSRLHKQYSFQPEPPFYLEVHYLDQSKRPDFILRILTQKVIQSK